MLAYFESLGTILLNADLFYVGSIDWVRVQVVSDCIAGLAKQDNK